MFFEKQLLRQRDSLLVKNKELEKLLDAEKTITKGLAVQTDLLKKENLKLRTVMSNPPKYTNGDKIGNLLIISVKYNDLHKLGFLLSKKFHQNVAFILFGGRILHSKEDVAKDMEDYKSYYIYEVFNTETNEKQEIKEAELLLIANAR